MNRHSLRSLIFALVLAGAAQAQGPAEPAFGQLPYTEVLTPPMPVSAKSVPLTFSSENSRSNFVTGGIQLGVGFDDNALSSPDHQVSDLSYLVLPHIEIGQTRERWKWDLAYNPGFTINQRFSQRNQTAQNLNFALDYRLSPHVALQLSDNFDKTNNLFSGLLGNPLAPGPGPIQQPNPSAVTPLAERTGNTSGVDLTYQFGAGSMVGASGSYYFVNYGAIATSSGQPYSLIDSRSAGADGFYAHRFAGRHWTGMMYDFQRLTFNPGNRTDVQRALWFYSVSLTSHMTFSLWAGPEYSTTLLSAVLLASPSKSRWTGAGGAAYAWQGNHTSFQARYVRQTSDGGGLAEAVTYQQADAGLRQRLAARWTATADVAYARNNPLNAATAIPPFQSVMGNAGLECRITDHLALNMRYGRDHVRYEQTSLLPQIALDRNRAWFSVSYFFSRPLGR